MGKGQILTQDEFNTYHFELNKMLSILESYCKTHHLNPADVNVLDWGCGRGEDVITLRKKGFNAFGVELSLNSINNGKPLIEEMGFDPSILTVLDENGNAPFNNEFFDFIYSTQVFEHVEDMEKVAAELNRVTKSGGMGYHNYPAHRQFQEGHIFMPFIQWLPKNKLRKALISLYVRFGIEPHWYKHENYSTKEKIEKYYYYINHHTFYRPFRAIKHIFTNTGFSVSIAEINVDRFKKRSIKRLLLSNRLSLSIIQFIMKTFKFVELITLKKSS